MTDDKKIEVHLDGELKYRKEKGEWLQVYCMYKGSSLFHEVEWVDIENWRDGRLRIASTNSIVVPARPFLKLLEDFIKEMEEMEKPEKSKERPLKIYIAGPYSPKNCDLHTAPIIAHRNVKKAIEVFWKLVKKGHYPYIPHLSHFIHLETPEDMIPPPQEFWYKFDLEWLKSCDAIFMLEGWENSRGARLELETAKKLGLQIFFKLEDVP